MPKFSITACSPAADEVVLSCPRREDEIELEASPFIAKFAADFAAAGSENFREAATLINDKKPPAENFSDDNAPAFDDDAPASGGTSLLENQAKCPFRATAIHRLGARETEPNEQGLNPADRGSLLHKTLQLVWQKIENSARLKTLSDDELNDIINAATKQAARKFYAASGCGAAFQNAQAAWLFATVREWLSLEKLRARAFVVEALEAEFKHDINGLELTFKVDRIDRLEDGSLEIIDYKTGAISSVKNWLGARPQSPQLPLYALAQTSPVATVAYGIVRHGECSFSGLSRADGFADSDKKPTAVAAPETHRSTKNDDTDWGEITAHWRRVLPELAQEFRAGVARVAPYTPEVCAYCDLPGLCRIDANVGDQTGDESADESAE